MGFPLIWRNWIAECLHTSRISVLINGSPTSEFGLGRGLRQGDPLAPFLFLIVVEGLNSMMSNVVQANLFIGYKVGRDKVQLSHLQFADDTIILGESSMSNIWVIKAFLQLFELVSVLKVNFHKSKLYGVNVGQGRLEVFAKFMNCGVGSILFIYLGCFYAFKIWMSCLQWFGFSSVQNHTDLANFEQFVGVPNCNVVNRVRWSSLWLVTLWSIWLARNEAVFSQKFMDPEEVVDLIKLRSWNWLRAKDSAFQYLFALWSNNSFSCLNFS
uniref:Reverse transcriptase domain-containing protein n=1 Tax=Cajanus cajan TaxID=3821 RepID=A0A151SCB4_CAJCA|nr:hypothetical protein KK1_025722 [Cajanus cajan]